MPSNTGKLLEALLPMCEVFLCDVPEDIARFDAALQRVSGRAFVLFPSEDAVPVSEVSLPSNGAKLHDHPKAALGESPTSKSGVA